MLLEAPAPQALSSEPPAPATVGASWPAPAAAAGETRWAAVLIFLCAAALLMPLVYGLVAFHTDWTQMAERKVQRHVALNTVANLIVMASGLSLTGRFDQRLGQVFANTLLVHGALAFFTLVTRHYYSIPMMLTAAPASAVLGGLMVMARGDARLPRVAVVGPWRPELAQLPFVAAPLSDASAGLQAFDFLVVTFPGEIPPAWAPVLSRALLAGKRLRHITDCLEEARGVVSIRDFEPDHLPQGGLSRYRTSKRLFDVVSVVACAPLLAPVLLVAMAAVRLTMGAPVFFTQNRVGLGGRPFVMFKLRTMRPPSSGPTGQATAKGGDARITPLGAWLRRYRIDEIPQLWNVLIGDMSVIGPRPEQPGLAAEYARATPAFAYRTLVRPGITGWAQVRAGYAADLAETEVKLGYDLFYLKNLSFALDVQIFVRTFWTVVSGGGAR